MWTQGVFAEISLSPSVHPEDMDSIRDFYDRMGVSGRCLSAKSIWRTRLIKVGDEGCREITHCVLRRALAGSAPMTAVKGTEIFRRARHR